MLIGKYRNIIATAAMLATPRYIQIIAKENPIVAGKNSKSMAPNVAFSTYRNKCYAVLRDVIALFQPNWKREWFWYHNKININDSGVAKGIAKVLTSSGKKTN